MNYIDIINRNRRENAKVDWWPLFAYHYTNITNAVSILEMGQIYSRTNAIKLGIMDNDNASRQVIDMTNLEAQRAVRFYFRPCTPTQYYNEGYKHPQLRYDDDIHANCPVPVFFAFELSSFLSLQGCTFSEVSRAGGSPAVYSGAEAFSNLNFKMIYKTGPMEEPAQEKLYRQAELTQPSPMSIRPYLSAVLCRNSFEQSMLLMLLREKSMKLFEYYRPIIKVCRTDMFENNGLFIENIAYHSGKLGIVFSNSYKKVQYTQRQKKQRGITQLVPLKWKLEIEWYKSKNKQWEKIYRSDLSSTLDYDNPDPIYIQLPEILNAKMFKVFFYIENDLLGCKDFVLHEESTVF